MCNSLRFRLFASCLMGGTAVVCFFVSLGPAGSEEKTSSEQSVYHADLQHLWNRLHEALFVRVGSDGHAYGQDRLEPLLWRTSKHLLEERSNKNAIALLEEFLKNKGEKLIDDPQKRALLQRDLWLVFNWLEGQHVSVTFNDFAANLAPSHEAKEVRAGQERLCRPLAAVIDRLALSPKEIEELPDNYAAAIASGQFTRRFDPAKPDQPYLPSDLFSADGPWVCLGRPDGPVAPEHYLRGQNVFTNSVFLVFLRLPTGRAATLDYLKKLRSFNEPAAVKTNGETGNIPNPKLPELPDGAEFALVRRALLIDSSHRVAAAPLTESVQLRVNRSGQSFHELRLSRALLFAGRAGGLRPVGADERDFKTGFNAIEVDEIEFRQPGYVFPGRQVTIRRTCTRCHEQSGVFSFNSFYFFRGRSGGPVGRGASLVEMPVSELAGVAIKWKEGQPNWTTLRKILAE